VSVGSQGNGGERLQHSGNPSILLSGDKDREDLLILRGKFDIGKAESIIKVVCSI